MLRSAAITQGIQRSPNRAMLRAVGFGDGDFNKPIIGIANGYSTITPCNLGLNDLARRAEEAAHAAGGQRGHAVDAFLGQYPAALCKAVLLQLLGLEELLHAGKIADDHAGKRSVATVTLSRKVRSSVTPMPGPLGTGMRPSVASSASLTMSFAK